MKSKQLDSKLIRRIMAGATEKEITAAIDLWYRYLRLIDTYVAELERATPDSREEATYDTLEEKYSSST